MANLDFPRGAVPIKGTSGSEQTNTYVLAAVHDAIGEYDLVEFRADGCVHQAVAGSTTVVGIAAQAVAANVPGTILVYDDPNIEFQMQSNDASIAAQTAFGLAYDFVIGPPVRGRSIAEVNGASGATTATLTIKPLRVSPIVSQLGNALGANVLLDCRFNQHFYKAGSVGI